jgi:hypothetical protein
LSRLSAWGERAPRPSYGSHPSIMTRSATSRSAVSQSLTFRYAKRRTVARRSSPHSEKTLLRSAATGNPAPRNNLLVTRALSTRSNACLTYPGNMSSAELCVSSFRPSLGATGDGPNLYRSTRSALAASTDADTLMSDRPMAEPMVDQGRCR